MDKKKKLALSGIVISSAMLISSLAFSIAWFNGASHLSVSNINIGFTDKSLSISTDNQIFKQSLTKDDLMRVDYFKPVSSAFSDEWLARKETKPLFTGGYSGEPTSEIQNTSSLVTIYSEPSGYLSQPLYLLSSTEANVTLDASESFIKANHDLNVETAKKLRSKYPTLTEEEIVANLDKVEKSLRVSILVLNDTGSSELKDYNYYIIDPKKENETLYGGKLDNLGAQVYDYFNGKEVMYGEFNYDQSKIVYEAPQASRILPVGTPTCFNSGTEAGVSRLNVEESIKAGAFDIKKENSIALSDVENNFAVHLSSGVSKKVYLSLYLEGWDLDNTSFAKYSHFSMNLAWKIQSSGN